MAYPLRCEKGRGHFAFTIESTGARLALSNQQAALATLLHIVQSLDNRIFIYCQVLNTRDYVQTLTVIYDQEPP